MLLNRSALYGDILLAPIIEEPSRRMWLSCSLQCFTTSESHNMVSTSPMMLRYAIMQLYGSKHKYQGPVTQILYFRGSNCVLLT